MRGAFLILHGLGNHRPPDHWQFWLAAQLAADGHSVLYPALPDPDAPVLASWRATLDEQLSLLHGDEGSLSASLACLLWFRIAASLAADVRPDRLLLVSPPDAPYVPQEGADFRQERFDAAAVRDSVRGEIAIVSSDADPFNPTGAQARYADALGLTVHTEPGGAHITPSSGYGPWHWVASWCTQPGQCLSDTP